MIKRYLPAIQAAHDYLVDQEEVDSVFLSTERHNLLNETIYSLEALIEYVKRTDA